MVAREIRAFRTLSSRLVKAEERSILIGNLIAQGVGFKEEEDFIIHEESKLKGTQKFKKRREILMLTMKEKLRDNRISEGKIRKLRNRELRKIEDKNSRPCRRLRTEVRTLLTARNSERKSGIN